MTLFTAAATHARVARRERRIVSPCGSAGPISASDVPSTVARNGGAIHRRQMAVRPATYARLEVTSPKVPGHAQERGEHDVSTRRVSRSSRLAVLKVVPRSVSWTVRRTLNDSMQNGLAMSSPVVI
jgi:hypothetical protein